ncbi:hypothetical protein OROHE_023492 [Orobanche hederae]
MKNNTHTHTRNARSEVVQKRNDGGDPKLMRLPRWLSESCVVAATVVRDRREIPMATSDLPRRRPAAANEYSDSDQVQTKMGIRALILISSDSVNST